MFVVEFSYNKFLIFILFFMTAMSVWYSLFSVAYLREVMRQEMEISNNLAYFQKS